MSISPSLADEEARSPASPFVVCLLPARNCAGDLPDYFRSVARFADAVVALDDGSTDDTRAVLQGEPSVRTLLANPRRESFAGWNDSENRNRLLEAAAGLDPVWIMSLDADERLDERDAAALRAFLERDALPGLAYGFRVHRMLSEHAYDRAELWAFRLFRHEPGQRFPEQRLHLVPIPTAIGSGRFVRTTFRIQHIGGQTSERRQARFAKYREADAERAFQPDYAGLLAPSGPPRTWRPRAEATPELEPTWTSPDADLDRFEPNAPVLSAIIIAQNDAATIEQSVRAAVTQDCGHPFEVIVVASGSDATAEIVRRRFPSVTVVELDAPALPGRARNAGLAIARGEFVSFPGSHIQVEPGSFAERIRAHEAGYAMVTGSIINATLTRSGWASYFLDHSTALPTRPSDELHGAPAHCSYEIEALRAVGGFPEHMRAGEDTVVNERLWRLGYRAYRAQGIRLRHRSPCRGWRQLWIHHFERGRAMGQILVAERNIERAHHGLMMFWLFRYGSHRFRSVERHVYTWGDAGLIDAFERVRSRTWVAVGASWVGIWSHLLRSRPRSVLRAISTAIVGVVGDARRG